MACLSSGSIQKSPEDRSKSCDTVCSSNTSCFLLKKKPVHPLAIGLKSSYGHANKQSCVRQRVLSASRQKVRNVQSQLSDAKFHLEELARENQALKNLNRRQDKALGKYEGTTNDLPRLLNSHAEEVRTLTERNRTLKKKVTELSEQLKHRDDELLHVKKQLEHLDKLNKNKHLVEREKLTQQVEDLKIKLEKADEQNILLNRKLALKEKSHSQKTNAESLKFKQCQRNLLQALTEIDRLTKLINVKGDSTSLDKKEVKSETSLGSTSKPSILRRPSNAQSIKEKLIEVKLEPIAIKPEENVTKKDTEMGVLKSPAENVKARLASDARKRSHELIVENPKPPEIESPSESPKIQSEKPSRSNSAPKNLDPSQKDVDRLKHEIDKIKEKTATDFEEKLGSYCSFVVNTANQCSQKVEDHKESLGHCIEDTETIKQTVEELTNMEKKLTSEIMSLDSSELNGLLLKNGFQPPRKPRNNKLNEMVKQEEKDKLLATLRAIDKGDNLDNNFAAKHKTMQMLTHMDLYGDFPK